MSTMSNKELREKILDADDAKPVPIKIKEWDISAFIKPLDGESRYRIGQLAITRDHQSENTYIAEAYVCEGLVDENGEQIFSFEDRALLAKKNPLVIERIYDKVVKASGMTAGDQVEAEKK